MATIGITVLTKVSGKAYRTDATPLPGTGTSIAAFFLTTQRRLTQLAGETFQAFAARNALSLVMARPVILASTRRVLTTLSGEGSRAITSDSVRLSLAGPAVHTVFVALVRRTFFALVRRRTVAAYIIFPS